MSKFYLPYQFIPVTGKTNGQNTKKQAYQDLGKYDDDGNSLSPARHDLWLEGTRSGRIVCRLHLETPTFVGNVHNAGAPTPIEPYKWNKMVAIPANSLRGMIGSTLELLSQSSLRVLEDKFHPYFENIHKDLAPWKPKRRELTPAELMLGVIEDETKSATGSRNLASRLRFADGRPVSQIQHATEEQRPLQILSSPKPYNSDVDEKLRLHNDFNPDTPSTYFHARSQNDDRIPVKRSELQPPKYQEHWPNGRKVRLVHPINSALNPYRSADKPDQQVACQPMQSNQSFWFHIDFENLKGAELMLLVTALRPSQGFYHRLGLGKSLGLGAVKINIEGVFFVDRGSRYGPKALETKRYQSRWFPFGKTDSQDWPPRYNAECKARSDRIDEITSLDCDECLIDSDTLVRLLTVSEPSRLRANCPIRWRQGHKNEAAEPLPEVPRLGELPPLIGPPYTDSSQNHASTKVNSKQAQTGKTQNPKKNPNPPSNRMHSKPQTGPGKNQRGANQFGKPRNRRPKR